MIREVLVSVYLLTFKFLFSLFSFVKVKNKTVFVASFNEDISILNDKLHYTHPSHKQVILQTKKHLFKRSKLNTTLYFSPIYPYHYIKSIYHLATSSHIILDNYYGFLAVVNFKKNVKRIQIWHANGAFKKFGLEDLSNKNRSKKASKRFKRVYKNFTHIIVGSENMKEIFTRSFGFNHYNYIKTGIPRIEFYFSEDKISNSKERFYHNFLIPSNKKILLYAPTYRDYEMGLNDIHLDIDTLRFELEDEYILLLRIHPAVSNKFNLNKSFSEFVIDVSNYSYLNDLLTISDILITDYSSIPFEYALLNKPMIFYTYDLEIYRKHRGLVNDFKEKLPGPIVKDSKSLIKCIQHNDFSHYDVLGFAKSWNTYSNGDSAENIIKQLY